MHRCVPDAVCVCVLAHLACAVWWDASRAAQRREKLESELAGYKTNLIKESIRMGHNDLGEFDYERGELQVQE